MPVNQLVVAKSTVEECMEKGLIIDPGIQVLIINCVYGCDLKAHCVTGTVIHLHKTLFFGLDKVTNSLVLIY